MKSILKALNDPNLNALVGCIDKNDRSVKISEQFKLIMDQNPKYDKSFLWLICYLHEHSPATQLYIEANYKRFHQILDSGFIKKLARNGGFESHMWEMILCDILSASGNLQPKSAAGADFILETASGQKIQIEAVAPNESENENLRSIKPDYSKGNIFSISGKIEDLERPMLLRCLQGFDDKASMEYDVDMPLIIAINTSKVVGATSRDDYIIKRIFFGLGCTTITKKADGSFEQGLEQRIALSKPGMEDFFVGRFRDPKYKHVSGVIYTSQSSIGLIPGGWGWGNNGITYVPNPMATHKFNVDFEFFKTIICNEEFYQQLDAKRDFVSCV
jgi:hypothetical protein